MKKSKKSNSIARVVLGIFAVFTTLGGPGLLALTAPLALAEAEDRVRDWDLLGTTRLLDYTGSRDAGRDDDRDVENLPGRHCGYEGLRLQATNKAAKISRVRVVFGNGESQVLHQGSLILERGEVSNFMNFENRRSGDNDRCIDKVVIVGETLSRERDNSLRDQTLIRIYGVQ
jgi:hypothetical protein